jgi:glutamate 5-kinase
MTTEARTRELIRSARRIVVKVGTNALTGRDGRLDEAFVGDLSGQIAQLLADGLEVALVSSGAIGAGVAELDMPGRPKTLPMLQATAAIGQGQLMRAFHDCFGRFDLKVAQILLTRDDFHHRTRYLNIRNTIAALAECRVLPVINENDTVSVDEIRFGDNDLIAALVTNMIAAEAMVLLTDVEGFLRGGKPVRLLERIDEAVLDTAGATWSSDRPGAGGVGGMRSKLEAAAMVAGAGSAAVIANARTPNVLRRLLAGEALGTLCLPATRRMSARRRWIGHAARAAGKIFIDAGAAQALTRRGKSLLPSGITSLTGKFDKGANVTIIGPDEKPLARGLSNYSSDQLDKIKGLKSSQIAQVLGDRPYEEVVHRNNMTLM